MTKLHPLTSFFQNNLRNTYSQSETQKLGSILSEFYIFGHKQILKRKSVYEPSCRIVMKQSYAKCFIDTLLKTNTCTLSGKAALSEMFLPFTLGIMLTSPCSKNPIKPNFIKINVGFAVVCIILLFFYTNYGLGMILDRTIFLWRF